MQNIIRKVYLSIMVSILCMITLVTVTFAWVGFLDFSSFEQFQINLNSSELEEYGIEISLTGEDGSFGSSVDTIELKRNILINQGYSASDLPLDTAEQRARIENLFKNINLVQCSAIPQNNTFSDFKDISNETTRAYFKFDLYISAYHAFESGEESEFYLDTYLTGNLLEGTKETKNLINEYTYPSDFVNTASNGITANTKIKNNITIDSSSACRVAIQKYGVATKYDLSYYDTNSDATDLIIYQGGTAMPTYNPDTGVYSFGGIMEDKYNLALYDYNKKYPTRAKTVPSDLLSRKDIEFNPNGGNQIIDSSKPEEKIGVNQMMKMTIYFWFEGWDADCFDIIDRKPVTLNLNFSINDTKDNQGN